MQSEIKYREGHRMKILVLTASPNRDKVVDEQLAEELRKREHEVKVVPCLRNGRDAAIEFQPDIVVMPPIRNPYSRDFCEVARHWGMGLVVRHTEPSCDWGDYKKMSGKGKAHQILGMFPYPSNIELVSSCDEADILSRRKAGFPAVAVGALGLDIYFKRDYKKRFLDRAHYKKKFGLKKKKILTVASSWGFIDHAPDLNIDEIQDYKKDEKGRGKYISLVKKLTELLPDWDILLRPHPGLDVDVYKKELPGIAIDTESPATQVLINSDALIHSGSTMAIEAHFVGIPAFQYGDATRPYSKNWWHEKGSVVSRVSPNFKSVPKLAEAIKKAKGSNADPKVITELEKGRYGLMDGKATVRAAEAICKIGGKFKLAWPKATRDYDSIKMRKSHLSIVAPAFCGICKNPFVVLRDEYLQQIAANAGVELKLSKIYEACPHCAAKLVMPT